ncbi:hypothetical protein HIM_06156 [Hirsutella minnesotensis 3608]|uniref:Uncharacterized protein n=1 Tax=Hirsutella minnesotensis 3608 TaxID=1043627 RepID=A0A0F7ZNY5_9HYPO|nr:hypothetical protein HIM_06156 [Hirsutella minnesotensis 3608]
MQFSLTTFIGLAVVARAVDMVSQGGYGGSRQIETSIPENLKAFGKDIARFHGCFLERTWLGLKNKPGQISHDIRVSFNICLNGGYKYSGLIREVGADIGGLGLSSLCGAYEAGGRSEGNKINHEGHKPEPKPY